MGSQRRMAFRSAAPLRVLLDACTAGRQPAALSRRTGNGAITVGSFDLGTAIRVVAAVAREGAT